MGDGDQGGLAYRIRQRQRQAHVGRGEQLAQYEAALGMSPADPRRWFISCVFGQGGIGKSWLLERFREQAVRAGAATALVNEDQGDVVASMVAIAEQVSGDDRRAARRFLDLHRCYQERRAELEADPEARSLAAFLGRTAARVGVALGRQVPVAGAMAELVDEAAVGDQAAEFAAFLARKVHDHRERQLVQDPVATLSPLLAEVLRHAGQRRPVALFFDTYERTSDYLDHWIRQLLGGRVFGDLPESTLVTIAGREELDSAKWEAFEPVLRLPLEAFTPQEVHSYFALRGVRDERFVDHVMLISNGLPVLVAMLASGGHDRLDDRADPTATAVARFLRWIAEPELRQAALQAALPRWFDRDVLGTLVGEEEADRQFDWLQTMPFVRAGREAWTYHEVVRTQMIRLQRRESPRRWTEQHERLAIRYGGLLDEMGLHDHSHLWQRYWLERLYHRLCANPLGVRVDVLDEFLQSFTSLAGLISPLVPLIVETVGQAAVDAESPELRELHDSLRAIDEALAVDDYRWGAATFTALLDQPWVRGVVRATALHCRGQLNLRRHRHRDGLSDLDGSVAGYAEVLDALDPDSNPSLRVRLAWALAARGQAIGDQGEPADALRSYEDIQRRFAHDDDPDVQNVVAWTFNGSGDMLRSLGRWEDATVSYGRVVERFSRSQGALMVRAVRAMRKRASALGDLGRIDEAMAQYDRIDAEFGAVPSLETEVGRAHHRQADFLIELGRLTEAVRLHDELLSRFGASDDLEQQELVGWTLNSKGRALEQQGRSDEAIAAYGEVDRRLGSVGGPALSRPVLGVVVRGLSKKADALGRAGRLPEALAIHDELLRRFGDAAPESLLPRVAWALTDRVELLRDHGGLTEALDACDNVLQRFDGVEDPQIESVVAWTLVYRGGVLRAQGRWQEALTSYRDVVARFSGGPPLAWTWVARALRQEGELLGKLGRPEEALEAYGQVAGCHGVAAGTALRAQVAWAASEQGEVLAAHGQLRRAVEVFETALRDVWDAEDPALQLVAAWTLGQKGLVLAKLGRHEEALAAWAECERRFEASSVAIRRQVLRSMRYSARLLGEIGRLEEALAAYDRIEARFGAIPWMHLEVAWARTELAELLRKHGRLEAALEAQDDMLRRLGQSEDPASQELFGWTLNVRGGLLEDLGRWDDAMTAYREVVHRLENAQEPALSRVAWALRNEADALFELRRWADAVSTADEVLRRFGDSWRSPQREAVGEAMKRRGAALARMGRLDDALAAGLELADRFADAVDSVATTVAAALRGRADMLAEQGRVDEALAAYDDVAARFGQTSRTDWLVQAGWALRDRAALLLRHELPSEALRACDDLIDRYAAAEDPDLLAVVAGGLQQRARVLCAMDRAAEAVATCDGAIERLGYLPALASTAARLMREQSVSLTALGRFDDAIAMCNTVIDHYGASTVVSVAKQVAVAMGDRARLIAEHRDPAEALLVHDEVRQRFADAEHRDLRLAVARSDLESGDLLGRLERWEEALAAYARAEKRVDSAQGPEQRTTLARSLLGRGDAQARLGRAKEAAAAWMELEVKFGDDDDLATVVSEARQRQRDLSLTDGQ